MSDIRMLIFPEREEVFLHWHEVQGQIQSVLELKRAAEIYRVRDNVLIGSITQHKMGPRVDIDSSLLEEDEFHYLRGETDASSK
jgi:hypothetical protein